jgi:hypothetical protein
MSIDMPIAEAKRLCKVHAEWYPNAPSVSRTLLAHVEDLEKRLSDQDLTLAAYINRERDLVAQLTRK